MKKITAIIFLFFAFAVTADENQKLLDETWTNRILDAQKIAPNIKILKENIADLNDVQKASLKNLQAYLKLTEGNLPGVIELTNQVLEQNASFDTSARAKNLQLTALSVIGEIKDSFIIMYGLLDDLEKIKSDDIKSHILHTAVARHIYAGIFDKAQELSRRNLAYSRMKKVTHYSCFALMEAANLELEIESYSQAKGLYNDAKRSCAKFKAGIFNGFSDYKLSQIDFFEGNYQQARKVLEDIHNSGKVANYKIMSLEISLLLAKIYMKLELHDQAYQFVKPVFDFSEKSSFLFLKKDSAKVLADYYQNAGDEKSFNKYRAIFRETSIEFNKKANQRVVDYYQAMKVHLRRKAISKVTQKKITD